MLSFSSQTQYPRELYLEIQNNPHLIGRLTIIKVSLCFHVEVDLVFSESKKIYRHVTSIFNQDDEQEAVDLAIQQFSTFLKSFK